MMTRTETQRKEVQLSICIPTYNRADLLHSTLESIEHNIKPGASIEVVISDNASPDHTREVVESFSKRLSSLIYWRNLENTGPVPNLNKAIDLANGEFIWIFSDDDMMTEGAIQYLLEFLKINPEVSYVFYSRQPTDDKLQSVGIDKEPSGLGQNLVFPDGNELFISCQGQMPFLMGFYSSTVIKRQIWNDHVGSVQVISENYAWHHLLVILHAIQRSKCAIISKVGVLARLNYRQIKANSSVSLDDTIHFLLYAAELGYSKKQCIKTIQHILPSASKSFLADKAIGSRNDNIVTFLSKHKIKHLIIYTFPWFLLSLFPQKLLFGFWNIFSQKRQ